MDKSTIIQLVVCLGGIGSIVAGILYFLSFDSYMKDTDRRVEESEEKSLKTKNSIDFKKNHMALQEAVVVCGRF
ncbi:Uncharacterised protein [Turicibacter sanguinis]|nr:Uncharacterised protein [Turicibacter sanguinis]